MQPIPFIASPNCVQGRFGATPKFIILHGTAGGTSALNIANWFANPAAQAAAHYIIDQEGNIIQTVKETDTAFANGAITGPSGASGDGVHHDFWWDSSPLWNGVPNPNLITISIEHVKSHDDNSDTLTPPQQAASFALQNDICDRLGIPKRLADAQGGITGHFSMDPQNRSRCPGSYPWAALWEYLGGIPQGWHDDGAVLTAPNGIQVMRGFRQYVLENQWNRNNYPLEVEHAQSPLEISNPSLGVGTQQLFRWSMLGWTPRQGVFEEWIGEEVMALRAKIASLEANAKPATPLRSKP